MADTGYIFAGTGETVGTGIAWTLASNVTADDSNKTTILLGSTDTTRYLLCTNFDMSSIPAGSTIDGVEYQVVDFSETGNQIDWKLDAIKMQDSAGEITFGTPSNQLTLNWTGTDQTESTGGATELWGETISLAYIQDIDTGINLTATSGGASGGDGGIDAIRSRVYYTSELVAGSGTVVGATETQIVVANGRTIILTLVGVTWAVTAGGLFDAQRQGIIDGIDSAQTETLGWNNEVRDTMGVAQCIRTSDTVVTITLLAAEVADYKVAADEVLTATIPASAHSGAGILTDANFATIAASYDSVLPPAAILTQTNLSGAVTTIDDVAEGSTGPDSQWLLLAAAT